MNIENDLHDMASQPSDEHKTALRRQLVTHFDTVVKPQRKKRASWLPYALVPIGALCLLVAVNVFIPALKPGEQPSIAQKITEPLTSKQVLALAQAKLQEVTDLKPGEMFYIRAIEDTRMIAEKSRSTAGCDEITKTSERYINGDGLGAKSVFSTIDGHVYLVTTQTQSATTGVISAGDEYYYNKQQADKTYSTISCDTAVKSGPSFTDATNQKKNSDLKTPADSETAPDLVNIGNDLMSGNPSVQKSAFGVMQKSDSYVVQMDKHIANHDGAVIALIERGDTLGWQAYYFDQSSKQFVGFENSTNQYVILQQDIRAYKHDPQYVGPTPEGL